MSYVSSLIVYSCTKPCIDGLDGLSYEALHCGKNLKGNGLDGLSYEVLHCGKNLKGNGLDGLSYEIYINNSFSDEFKYLNYLVCKCKTNRQIQAWKVKNGITFLKVAENDNLKEISHRNDLIRLELIADVDLLLCDL